MTDILLALTPSLLLGSMSVLLIALGGDDRQRVLGILIGGFVTSLAAAPFLQVQWTPTTLVVSFISGLLLAWGIMDQTACIRVLGVSRTMPISTGAQLVFMSLGGVILFGEWRRTVSAVLGAAAILALIVGIWMTSRVEKNEDGAGDAANLDWARGGRLLVTSTIGLVVYLLLVRWFGIDGPSAMLPQAFGYLSAGLVLTAPRLTPWVGAAETRWSTATLKQALTGVAWGMAVLILQLSASRVGVATGFTLSQLGILISVPVGIFVFGERRTRKELVWTGLGVALVIVGAVLAGIAKGFDVG